MNERELSLVFNHQNMIRRKNGLKPPDVQTLSRRSQNIYGYKQEQSSSYLWVEERTSRRRRFVSFIIKYMFHFVFMNPIHHENGVLDSVENVLFIRTERGCSPAVPVGWLATTTTLEQGGVYYPNDCWLAGYERWPSWHPIQLSVEAFLATGQAQQERWPSERLSDEAHEDDSLFLWNVPR